MATIINHNCHNSRFPPKKNRVSASSDAFPSLVPLVDVVDETVVDVDEIVDVTVEVMVATSTCAARGPSCQ